MAETRAEYLTRIHNQSVLRNLDLVTTQATETALAGAADLDLSETGRYLRNVVPGLVNEYGTVSQTTAVSYYDQQYLNYRREGDMSRRMAQRAALAKSKGQIYAAQMPELKVDELSDPIINSGMKAFASGGHSAMVSSVTGNTVRAVAQANRDTMLFNSTLDPSVKTVYRVAGPHACEFCIAMTHSRYNYTAYAVHYHAHCRCSIEILRKGQKPIRPDYYDEFDKIWAEDGGFTPANFKAMREFRTNNPDLSQVAISKANGLRLDGPPTPASRIFGTTDYLNRQDEFDATYRNMPRQGDARLASTVKMAGFNGAPEYVKTIEELGDGVMYRGLEASPGSTLTPDQMIQRYLTDEDPFQGYGIFGNGTYFSNQPETALVYSGKTDAKDFAKEALSSNSVMVSSLKPDANVKRFASKDAYFDWAENVMNEARRVSPNYDMNVNVSQLAIAEGFDAIEIDMGSMDERYIVVLNRGALRVLR